MPIEGVDTFACLCVPDLECAVGGAADDDVVPHLGRPHAARVAHQGAQTLKRWQKRKERSACFSPPPLGQIRVIGHFARESDWSW